MYNTVVSQRNMVVPVSAIKTQRHGRRQS